MPAGTLATILRDRTIRTVLNLRGPNPAADWYRRERAAALDSGVTQVDIPLSSCVWMSRLQLRTLLDVLDHAEYPMLVHCHWGSERTGLTAAVAELLRPGGTLADARGQLALRFLYVRLGDGRIMAEFLDQYETWLASRGLEHSPDVFRGWARGGYVPGRPNREEWPYDPTPLVVITRPGAAGQGPTPGEPIAASSSPAERR
ncbi:MAG: tyrosine-protein phosphatase [Isosphaeraceae bacterium]